MAAAVATAALVAALAAPAGANTTAQSLPFAQNWTNPGLITTNDDWSGVPGIVGHLGDGMTAADDVDPQTVIADGGATQLDVIANQSNPDALTQGGVAEFDPPAIYSVGLQGSQTADAPHLLIHLDTSGMASVNVAYNLKDLEGGATDAVTPVALQYRVGSMGNFANVPDGFVADATLVGSGATTNVSATLPAAADDQPLVQVRVITTNSSGNDEWVGVDDINVTGTSTADGDGDGVPDASDNCPNAANANQADSDGDGVGDVCESTPGGGGGGGGGATGGGATSGGTTGGTTDTTRPGISFAPRRQTLRSLLRRGYSAVFSSNEAGRARVEVFLRRGLRRILIGRATRTIAAGRVTILVRLTRAGKRLLRRARSARLVVRITVTDAAGNAGTTSRNLTLRR